MKKVKFYKCDVCGNIVLKVEDKSERLVCCDKPMQLLKANTTDASQEKHVPVVNGTVKECKIADAPICEVQVGSVLHPMTNEHYINWIGSFDEEAWIIKWLNPGNEPKRNLRIGKQADVYEYCNLHGLWKK